MDRRRLAGVLLVVVSAIAFGSGALFAKPVYAVGLDWLTLLVWRFGIGAALAWGWLLASPARRAALRSTSRRQPLAALGLGAIYTLNSSTYFAALETVPASLASLIVYIYPVLVAVLTLRFGRPLSGRGPVGRPRRSPRSAPSWPWAAWTPGTCRRSAGSPWPSPRRSSTRAGSSSRRGSAASVATGPATTATRAPGRPSRAP